MPTVKAMVGRIFMLCLFTNVIVLVDYDCVFRAIMIYNVVLHCGCIHETIYYVMGKMFWNVLEFMQ